VSEENNGMAAGSFCAKHRQREWESSICGVKLDELNTFVEFSGLFLSNMGNYFVRLCHILLYYLLTHVQGEGD
jgi:hypothetical protein